MKISSKLSLNETSISFQTIIFGLGHGIGLLRGFFSLFILSRILNARDFGVLGALYAFSNLAVSILTMGTNSANRVVVPALERPQRETQFWGLIQASPVQMREK